MKERVLSANLSIDDREEVQHLKHASCLQLAQFELLLGRPESRTCTRVRTCERSRGTHTHTDTHTQTHTHTHTQEHTDTHTQIHRNTRTHTHTQSHTHACACKMTHTNVLDKCLHIGCVKVERLHIRQLHARGAVCPIADARKRLVGSLHREVNRPRERAEVCRHSLVQQQAIAPPLVWRQDQLLAARAWHVVPCLWCGVA